MKHWPINGRRRTPPHRPLSDPALISELYEFSKRDGMDEIILASFPSIMKK